MKRISVLFMVLVFTMMAVQVSFAGGGAATGGATEFTQRANLGQLQAALRQAQEQVDQLKSHMDLMNIHKTLLPGSEFANIADTYFAIRDTMQGSERLLFTMANYGQELQNIFRRSEDFAQNLTTLEGFENELRQMRNAHRNSLLQALENVGMTADDIRSDAQALNTLQSRAANAEGHGQLMDAANELTAFNAQQLVKLREAIALQSAMIGEAMYREQSEKELVEESFRQIMTPIPRNPVNVHVPNW